jgi:hypothetical protein
MNRYVSTVAVADDETRAGMFGGTAAEMLSEMLGSCLPNLVRYFPPDQ